MNSYLFTLTITPVQSFISQARKTKDLFAGSEILSTLIRETIEKAKEEYNAKIIFPQNSEFTSNKFVLELEDTDPKILGSDLESFIREKFYLSSSLIAMQDRMIKTDFIDKYLKPQLCNFFQVFWVAVELKDSYQESYKKLEQSLGAVKNLRAFEQLEQIGARKCSVCGERNGLFYRDIKDKKPKYILDTAIAIKGGKNEKIYIKDNETLCAVCFTKRFYQEDGYPSTAKIALLDWLKKLDEEEIEKYDSYFRNFDEALYFKENLSKEYLKKWEHFKSDSDLEKAKKFLEDIGTAEQKKYYALLHFDIDDMGKKLSGLERDKQIELSNVLANFSSKVKSIVDGGGKTIYAGGDDFLGFVNLEYLFGVIKCVQRAFKQIVKKEFSNLTFSMGIIISHYKEPLHIGLDRVRDIIHFAKEFDNGNKNGLAISVLKHSGETLQARIENNREKVENLSQIIKLVQEDFSDKFIINLELEFRNLVGDKDKLMVSKEMLEVELKRLIKNSLLNKNHKEKIDKLNNLIKLFIEHRQMSNFFHLLEIVRFIKRGLK